MDEKLGCECHNPLLTLRLQRPGLRKTTAQRLGYLDLSPEAILYDLIAKSETSADPALKAEAHRALLRYARALMA